MRTARRGGHEPFLEHAASMRAQIARFANAERQRVDDPKLTAAIEELRAQNEALFEACSRLQRESAKYRDLYDRAPDPLVTTDERAAIEDANEAAASFFRLRQEILPGKLLIGFVARSDVVAFRDHLRAVLSGSGRGTFSVRMRPRGGGPVLAHLAVRVVSGTVRSLRGRRDLALHWTIRFDPEASAGSTAEGPQEMSLVDLAVVVRDRLRPLAAARDVANGSSGSNICPPTVAMARVAIEQHGGALHVPGIAEAGAVFCLRLPGSPVKP